MAKLNIVIATGNNNKVREYKELFEGLDIEVTSMKDEGIDIEIDENGLTFQENSMIKATAVASHTSKIVIADDSGLCINALNDFPGIKSARFMEGQPYEEKHKAILEMLKDKEDKSAYFVCAISLVNLPNNKKELFVGRCEGTIIEPEYGEHGFGYDPIFKPNGKDVSFSMMSDEEKNSISHRGQASALLIDYLKKLQ